MGRSTILSRQAGQCETTGSPEGLWSTPKHQLVAFLAGPDDAAQATTELVTAGFLRDVIYVLVGEDAMCKIDPTGKHHGLGRRTVRLSQEWTSAGDNIEEDADHVAGGGVILLVPAYEDDEVARDDGRASPTPPDAAPSIRRLCVERLEREAPASDTATLEPQTRGGPGRPTSPGR
jgi:hypothetical protein